MLEPVLRIYKKLGETPLEALNRLRLEMPEYSDVPMTYAGRLDPMAEGELLVLTGEECKKKDDYLGMNKEYEFEMLFGFKTDSYDLLGLSQSVFVNQDVVKKNFEKELLSFQGKRLQQYPPFSSKTIGGVPLFKKTKDGDNFVLPEREIEIFSIEFLGFKEMKGKELLFEIQKRVSLVNGDFRQEEVLRTWRENFQDREVEVFLIGRTRMTCSSGTYVRSLVNSLSFPATTFSIKRTKIF